MPTDPLAYITEAIQNTQAELQKLERARQALSGDDGTGKRGSRRGPRARYRTVTIPEKTDRNGVTRKAHTRRVKVS